MRMRLGDGGAKGQKVAARALFDLTLGDEEQASDTVST